MTFEKTDIDVFRNLGFAYYAMDKGGNMPCILNASNEIVVFVARSSKRSGFRPLSTQEDCQCK